VCVCVCLKGVKDDVNMKASADHQAKCKTILSQTGPSQVTQAPFDLAGEQQEQKPGVERDHTHTHTYLSM